MKDSTAGPGLHQRGHEFLEGARVYNEVEGIFPGGQYTTDEAGVSYGILLHHFR